MNNIRFYLCLTVLLTLAFGSIAQDAHLLDSLPKTRDEFVQSEPKLLKVIDWIENTPFEQQGDKQTMCNAYLLAWLTNSPTVTVTVNDKIFHVNKKNGELLFVFIGGWTRYCLEHAYSKHPVQCNVAGLKSMLKAYSANLDHGVRKDKDVEKLLSLDQSGLEAYVKERL